MSSIVLFPFRYRDARTGKWVRARYLASREEIGARYTEWEITGEPEVREPHGHAYANPYRVIAHAEMLRIEEPAPDMQPMIDACERFLAALFLRRYITWCARARRFDRIDGATFLYRTLGDPTTPRR